MACVWAWRRPVAMAWHMCQVAGVTGVADRRGLRRWASTSDGWAWSGRMWACPCPDPARPPAALNSLEGEFKGRYYPLKAMTEQEQQQLIDDHFLFDKPVSPLLLASGMARDWPDARGIWWGIPGGTQRAGSHLGGAGRMLGAPTCWGLHLGGMQGAPREQGPTWEHPHIGDPIWEGCKGHPESMIPPGGTQVLGSHLGAGQLRSTQTPGSHLGEGVQVAPTY